MPAQQFNFRNVADRLGIPLSNRNNWRLGQLICQVAADLGHQPDRILTEKTNPTPTVAAPHCIGHYPIEIFEDVCREVGVMFEEDDRQEQFDFD